MELRRPEVVELRPSVEAYPAVPRPIIVELIFDWMKPVRPSTVE
jgi:hypothetical protein